MRATVMYGAGDVRIESVPDARLIEATDALVVVKHAAICGSDLWPYKSMEHSETGRRMGHEAAPDPVVAPVCSSPVRRRFRHPRGRPRPPCRPRWRRAIAAAPG